VKNESPSVIKVIRLLKAISHSPDSQFWDDDAMLVESSLHEKAERIVVFEILDWRKATNTREAVLSKLWCAHRRENERRYTLRKPRGRVRKHAVIEDAKRLQMVTLANPADGDSTVSAARFEAVSQPDHFISSGNFSDR